MNKISFPRIGVDGKTYSKDDIEKFFCDKFEGKIRANLSSLILDNLEKRITNVISHYLKAILLASPERLEKYKELADSWLNKLGDAERKDYKNKLLEKFNYINFRSGKLVDLSKMLNVKCCPYCNMQYTLYAEETHKRKVKKLAKLQFDHFIDKIDYPMFSMSLYNLIPSCSVCNQGKSTGQLALEYNPYYSEIGSLFHFRLTDPLGPYTVSRINDEVDVSLVPENGVNGTEFKNFEEKFHLKALYGRHGDIVQEVFDKAYEDPYYLNPSNFSFLGDRAPSYLQRLWLGNYTEPEEIEKRPMAKFMQDLWLQAKGKI